jgi:hypothetical protein
MHLLTDRTAAHMPSSHREEARASSRRTGFAAQVAFQSAMVATSRS